MSERRGQVLVAVQHSDGHIGVAEVADQLGIHANTARFHLEALVEDGVIERVSEPPSGGRGRPRISYRARPGLARGGARRYRLLSEMLLSHLAGVPGPGQAARRTGRAWGTYLVSRPAPGHETDAVQAGARLTTMLDELDFAPELVTDSNGVPRLVRLRHCPFLELAGPHRDLVCTLHLGLMQGALAELGAPLAVTRLEPFAEPAACLVHLQAAPQQAPRQQGQGQ